MVARGDRELAEQVGVVGRSGARRAPRLCDGNRLGLGPRSGNPGANLGLAEQAPHPGLVETGEKTPGGLGALGAAGTTDVEDELPADLAGVHGAEDLRSARQVAGLLGRQRQPDVIPADGQVLLERAPLIDELHRPSA
jgi:hypothetical protein